MVFARKNGEADRMHFEPIVLSQKSFCAYDGSEDPEVSQLIRLLSDGLNDQIETDGL